MKLSVVALVAASLFLVTGSAFASQELSDSNNCTMCHKLDTKGPGPSYQEIAAKYKDDTEAAAKLEKSINEGSTGKYGGMPMAAQAQAKADAKAISEWIMTLAK